MTEIHGPHLTTKDLTHSMTFVVASMGGLFLRTATAESNVRQDGSKRFDHGQQVPHSPEKGPHRGVVEAQVLLIYILYFSVSPPTSLPMKGRDGQGPLKIVPSVELESRVTKRVDVCR